LPAEPLLRSKLVWRGAGGALYLSKAEPAGSHYWRIQDRGSSWPLPASDIPFKQKKKARSRIGPFTPSNRCYPRCKSLHHIGRIRSKQVLMPKAFGGFSE
jgi:hypothetical protein